MSRLTIFRYKGQPVAECKDCDRLRADATRERVWGHVRQTGHSVRMTVEHVTVYGPPEQAAQPGNGSGAAVHSGPGALWRSRRPVTPLTPAA